MAFIMTLERDLEPSKVESYPLISKIGGKSAEKVNMVGVAGIEPATNRL